MAFREEDRPRVPAGEPGGGRWVAKSFSSYDETVADISDVLESTMDDGEYEEYGIRVEDLQNPGKAGDDLPPSRVWIDGKPTGETLDGTSVLSLKSSDKSEVDRALRTMGLKDGSSSGYFGKVIYLVGGDGGSHGEDPGERIVRGAKIVSVYIRDKNAFAPIKSRL